MGERPFKKGQRAHIQETMNRNHSSADLFIRDVKSQFQRNFTEGDYKFIVNQLNEHFSRGRSKAVFLEAGIPSTWAIPWANTHIVFTYDTKRRHLHLLRAHTVEIQVKENGTQYKYKGFETFVPFQNSPTTAKRD